MRSFASNSFTSCARSPPMHHLLRTIHLELHSILLCKQCPTCPSTVDSGVTAITVLSQITLRGNATVSTGCVVTTSTRITAIAFINITSNKIFFAVPDLFFSSLITASSGLLLLLCISIARALAIQPQVIFFYNIASRDKMYFCITTLLTLSPFRKCMGCHWQKCTVSKIRKIKSCTIFFSKKCGCQRVNCQQCAALWHHRREKIWIRMPWSKSNVA